MHVQITPTYSGCPAMETIRTDLVDVLSQAGFRQVCVEFVLAPAWTTDWMTDAGREKLAAYGVAPPGPRRTTDRCRCSSPCAAPSAAASTPASRAGSGRRRASRSGCAAPAASPSTTSSPSRAARDAPARGLPPPEGRRHRRADRRLRRDHVRRPRGAAGRLRLRPRPAPQHPWRRRRTPLLLHLHPALLRRPADRGQAAPRRRVQPGRRRPPADRRPARGLHPGRPVHHRARPGVRQALRRHRRGVGHHPGALDRGGDPRG